MLERSGLTVVVEENGVSYTKVDFTRNEEIANVATHAVSAVLYVGLLIYLLTLCRGPKTVVATLLTCLPAISVYTVSAIYHGTADPRRRFYIRKLDHGGVPFLVVGCSVPLCLLTGDYAYNYVALGISVALCFVSAALSFRSVDRFKGYTILIDFVIGALMFACYFVNRSFVPPSSGYLYLAGALLCVAGSVVFGLRRSYTHSVFHVLILSGTLCFYAVAVEAVKNAGIL